MTVCAMYTFAASIAMSLPFTVLRRLDAVLESTKDKVLAQKKLLDKAKIANPARAAMLSQASPKSTAVLHLFQH